MKINYHVLNDSVVLNYNGKTKVIASGDDRHEKVLTCIREGRLKDIPEVVEIERRYDGDGIKLKDGILMANNEPLPAELEARILKFKEQRLPYDALLKFWDNLKKNPSFNSRQQLFKFLEHNGHPLTEDGCFIAYRGVTEDFKDAHTKSFDNKPGSVCEMPRAAVDDNPNNTCSSGLHVACFDYAKGFAQRLVEVKVNPADVVCVPVDYNGTKMRTCRFEVIQEVDSIHTGELRTFEHEEEENDEEECPDCSEGDRCFQPDCVGYSGPETEEEAAQRLATPTTEVNGLGKSRQLRHAVRGPGGRFVKQGA